MNHVITGLALALTFGGMTFFSLVLAPLVFTKLPLDIAAAFIRQVFPWYYLTMGITTLVALVTLVLEPYDVRVWEIVSTGLVLAGFVYARQVLMPMINRARDAEMAGDTGAARRFKRLHGISVIINGVQWLAVLTALIWVLM